MIMGPYKPYRSDKFKIQPLLELRPSIHKAKLSLANVTIKDLKAEYQIGNRRIYLGSAESANVLVTNADEEAIRDEWLFDLMAKINFKKFDFNMNIVNIINDHMIRAGFEEP